MTAVGVICLGAIGALMRWRVGVVGNRALPWGTLGVNVVGSLLLGLVAGQGDTATTVIGVGLLGSVTTFSTVMVETHDLRERRGRGVAAAYLGVTLVGGVGAAAIGLAWA